MTHSTSSITPDSIVLGSQSPRRQQLLQSVIAPGRLVVLPPQSDQEAGFHDCTSKSQIATRIREITATKLDDVWAQVCQAGGDGVRPACVVCADTIVVVDESAGDHEGHSQQVSARVLGKPPSTDWQETVRDWFRRYYAAGTHEVWSCVGVLQGSSQELSRESFIVQTEVAMGPIDDGWIDWYVSTGEPVGKAGGYGIQGLAAHMIAAVNGSLTNVIGLPMMELVSALRKAGVELTERDASTSDGAAT